MDRDATRKTSFQISCNFFGNLRMSLQGLDIRFEKYLNTESKKTFVNPRSGLHVQHKFQKKSGGLSFKDKCFLYIHTKSDFSKTRQ